MSSRARRMARGVMAAVWRGVARSVGRIVRWQPAPWHSPGGQRVLVVAPHPDDEIGCGGAVLLHQRVGDEVHLVHVTDGRGSRAGGLAPDDMARQRRVEAGEAARALGLSSARTHWFGLREDNWEDGAVVRQLHDLMQAVRPSVLYAPSLVDFHPDHVRVAGCLARALEGPGLPALSVRVYQMQVPLTPVLVNVLASIDTVADALAAATRCYRTQLGSLERCLRMKRYGAALYAGAALAEEFWELDPNAYRRVHAAPRRVEISGAFRGVRARPFSDPLSYLRGLRARRGLREQARRQ